MGGYAAVGLAWWVAPRPWPGAAAAARRLARGGRQAGGRRGRRGAHRAAPAVSRSWDDARACTKVRVVVVRHARHRIALLADADGRVPCRRTSSATVRGTLPPSPPRGWTAGARRRFRPPWRFVGAVDAARPRPASRGPVSGRSRVSDRGPPSPAGKRSGGLRQEGSGARDGTAHGRAPGPGVAGGRQLGNKTCVMRRTTGVPGAGGRVWSRSGPVQRASWHWPSSASPPRAGVDSLTSSWRAGRLVGKSSSPG